MKYKMRHHHPAVSREEWLKAQQAHLKTEKALTRMRDLVAAERRALPWLRVEKAYIFDTAEGERTLGDLFGGNSQLIVHHLMFHPDWEAACVGCSFQADHIDGPRPHLERHDVSIVAISRAPIQKITAYRKRMGWRFLWVSSDRSDFNQDFHVTFGPEELKNGRIDYNFGTITVDPRYHSEELPGVSVFYRDAAGDIFLTQSIYPSRHADHSSIRQAETDIFVPIPHPSGPSGNASSSSQFRPSGHASLGSTSQA